MRYCEHDGCEVFDDMDSMVRLGDEWYCLAHAAETNREDVLVQAAVVVRLYNADYKATDLTDAIAELERMLNQHVELNS